MKKLMLLLTVSTIWTLPLVVRAEPLFKDFTLVVNVRSSEPVTVTGAASPCAYQTPQIITRPVEYTQPVIYTQPVVYSAPVSYTSGFAYSDPFSSFGNNYCGSSYIRSSYNNSGRAFHSSGLNRSGHHLARSGGWSGSGGPRTQHHR